MAEQLHEGVDADVGAGEFRGVGVPQSVDQGSGDGLSVGAGAFERPFERDCSVPRVMRSPLRPTNSGDPAGHRGRPDPAAAAFRFTASGNRMARLFR